MYIQSLLNKLGRKPKKMAIQSVFQNNNQSSIPINPIDSAGAISSGNSVLFLFSPRHIENHVTRPLTYNFNVNMLDAISEHIVDRPSLNGIRSVLNGTANINTAIVPASRDTIELNTSVYSDNWFFLLCVDSGVGREQLLSNRLVERTILIGICSDIPISHSGIAASVITANSLNPNCRLIVTKQLSMNKYTTLHVNGPTAKVKTTRDNSIVEYDDRVWFNPMSNQKHDFYTLTPGNTNAATTISDNEMTSLLDHSESLNVKGSISLQASGESPRQHMKDILTAFESGAAHLAHNEQIGDFGDIYGAMSAAPENFEGYVHASLNEERILMSSLKNTDNPLIANMNYLTLGMVAQMYSPKINVIKTPTHSNAELIPQRDWSVGNVFSSLVCSVIPTYLNTLGLSAISFMYNSAADASKVLHIESMLNTTQDELHRKFMAFDFLLRNELYPVLHDNGGHFDLQVMSSINGTTDCVLNFLDFEPIPFGAIYQENTVLGGINSQLIGTSDHLLNNSVRLNNLIKNVSSNIHNSGANY